MCEYLIYNTENACSVIMVQSDKKKEEDFSGESIIHQSVLIIKKKKKKTGLLSVFMYNTQRKHCFVNFK